MLDLTYIWPNEPLEWGSVTKVQLCDEYDSEIGVGLFRLGTITIVATKSAKIDKAYLLDARGIRLLGLADLRFDNPYVSPGSVIALKAFINF